MASHHVSEQKVWDMFYALFNNNAMAAAGACGNMQWESGLYSDNAENLWNNTFCHSDEWLTERINNSISSTEPYITLATFLQESWYVNAYGFGYGLSQWTTASRRTQLWNRTISIGLDIDDEDAQLNYIKDEFTTGAYQNVRTEMIGATTVLEATQTYCRKYEGGSWDYRRYSDNNGNKGALYFYKKYATDSLSISLAVTGNGIASVSNYFPTYGEMVDLYAIPNQGETLNDIYARTVTGDPMALSVVEQQTFPMPAESIIIYISFSGSTPPQPPTPTPAYTKRKHMPIWMYPLLRK